MPAGLGESGTKLRERSNQRQIDRVTRQPVPGDGEMRHVLMPQHHQPHTHDIGKDHIGGDGIGRGERQHRRQLSVDPLEDVDDQPDAQRAEAQDGEALEGQN